MRLNIAEVKKKLQLILKHHNILNFFHQIPSILLQKQQPEIFCVKRCSQKLYKIRRKTPMQESLFNKVGGLKPATLLKKRLLHRCFSVNFVKFLRTLFSQNTFGRLLLLLGRFMQFCRLHAEIETRKFMFSKPSFLEYCECSAFALQLLLSANLLAVC